MAEISSTVGAMLNRIIAIGDAIHKLGQIPEGHMYARIMGQMTVDEFNVITEILIEQKLIKRENNVLIWIG